MVKNPFQKKPAAKFQFKHLQWFAIRLDGTKKLHHVIEYCFLFLQPSIPFSIFHLIGDTFDGVGESSEPKCPEEGYDKFASQMPHSAFEHYHLVVFARVKPPTNRG
jgi:hypothetical protein